MANANDDAVIREMLAQPDALMADWFARNSDRIIDDATYWNVLGSLWKLGGTVVQQDIWRTLFNSPRGKRHKIMKSRERRCWRRLPNRLTAYRAVNHEGEIDTAISWTLSREVAERFSQEGLRKVVSREFNKSEVFAFFDRRKEEEILVNL